MIRSIILTITTLIASACCTQKLPPCGPCEDLDAVIISSPSDDLFTDALADKFEDGTPVEVVETELDEKTGAYYLVREGHTSKKDCRVTRTPLYESKEGFLYMRRNGASETCTGNGCSHCAFKTGGGCTCVNSTNTCSHTITRNNVLFKR
jgi:hypothetical protein